LVEANSNTEALKLTQNPRIKVCGSWSFGSDFCNVCSGYGCALCCTGLGLKEGVFCEYLGLFDCKGSVEREFVDDVNQLLAARFKLRLLRLHDQVVQ
jgi:hypothetical protein